MATQGTRDVRNNWVLLAAVAAVSLAGAGVYAIAGDGSAAIPVYFVVGSSAVAATGFWWFGVSPPAMRAPAWAYVATVVTLMLGAFFAGAIPGSHAVGAWIAVGLGFVVYGALERSAVISVAGALSAAAGLLGIAVELSNLGIWLELVTAVIFASAAVKLRNRPVA